MPRSSRRAAVAAKSILSPPDTKHPMGKTESPGGPLEEDDGSMSIESFISDWRNKLLSVHSTVAELMQALDALERGHLELSQKLEVGPLELPPRQPQPPVHAQNWSSHTQETDHLPHIGEPEVCLEEGDNILANSDIMPPPAAAAAPLQHQHQQVIINNTDYSASELNLHKMAGRETPPLLNQFLQPHPATLNRGGVVDSGGQLVTIKSELNTLSSPTSTAAGLGYANNRLYNDTTEDIENIENLNTTMDMDEEDEGGRLKGTSWPCDRCTYISTRRSDLRKHQAAVHDGKRYPCDECEYQATQPNSLKVHKLAKHSGVTFPCDQCDYKAAQKGSLRNHKRSMHDGERYPCDECDFVAKWLKILKVHKKTKHATAHLTTSRPTRH